ncbi:hypothetical protein [Roseisolibacter sp. H3M3-2]|uniref:hypothetical protein n=1 Tax=Roseisolibacter sp. H3M3-2 TaxID=3031323 RepID=UPI0023DA5CDA|nr:hypothetical protein [Roseisolibacter sp. H3M3-2]MDF1502904.1 hypothetical protein [Roseisolibacter sp. H3M3-2]
MDAVRLSRLTTVLVVVAAGGVAGHVWFPFAPGAGVARPAGFVALMLVVGALRGWRPAVVAAAPDPAPDARRRALLLALAAAAAALLGHVVMHGAPG